MRATRWRNVFAVESLRRGVVYASPGGYPPGCSSKVGTNRRTNRRTAGPRKVAITTSHLTTRLIHSFRPRPVRSRGES